MLKEMKTNGTRKSLATGFRQREFEKLVWRDSKNLGISKKNSDMNIGGGVLEALYGGRAEFFAFAMHSVDRIAFGLPQSLTVRP